MVRHLAKTTFFDNLCYYSEFQDIRAFSWYLTHPVCLYISVKTSYCRFVVYVMFSISKNDTHVKFLRCSCWAMLLKSLPMFCKCVTYFRKTWNLLGLKTPNIKDLFVNYVLLAVTEVIFIFSVICSNKLELIHETSKIVLLTLLREILL